MTTMTIPTPIRTTSVRPTAGVTAAYAAHDLGVTLRNVSFVVFTIALPMAMFVMFRMMFDGQSFANSQVYASLMVNIASYGGFAAAMNAGARIQLERQSGWMRQLTAAGLPPRAFVTGKAVSALLVVLPAIIGTFAVGAAWGGITEPVSAWLASAALIWASMAPFVLLGLLIGLWMPVSAVYPVVTVAMMTLAMLGGLWWPSDALPAAVQTIGEFLPTYWLGELARAPFMGDPLPIRAVAVLGAWTLVTLVGAALGFRRAARTSKR